MSCRGEGAVGEEESFVKWALKRGLLVHSEQSAKCGGGHWIFSLFTVFKLNIRV